MIVQAWGYAVFPNSELIFGTELTSDFEIFFHIETENKLTAQHTALKYIKKHIQLSRDEFGRDYGLLYFTDDHPEVIKNLLWQKLIELTDLVTESYDNDENLHSCWKCKKNGFQHCDIDENNFRYFTCSHCGNYWHELNK